MLEDRLSADPPPDVRRILHRIAREALANVRKHANADEVEVVLEERDDGVLDWITDDGLGYNEPPNKPHLPGHLGLPAMRERAEIAGGWWRIDSAAGEGTTVEFWVPTAGLLGHE